MSLSSEWPESTLAGMRLTDAWSANVIASPPLIARTPAPMLRRSLQPRHTARLLRAPVIHACAFSLAAIHPVILAPLVFAGLTLTLWSYKCLMLILFQSRIIYMPYLPLGARADTLDAYAPACRPLVWRAHTLRTPGARLAVASTTAGPPTGPHVLIAYFQGNAGSTPARTPALSAVVAAVARAHPRARLTLVAPSYRGFWTSTGTPSQRAIARDLPAVLAPLGRADALVLWGQSIGCGVAAAAAPLARPRALVLETPFLGVRAMLQAVYPERWLPYRYLGWALWNRWELVPALRGWRGRALVLEAGRDELVPAGQAAAVADALRAGVVRVEGALHVECMSRPGGRRAVVDFLSEIVDEVEKEMETKR